MDLALLYYVIQQIVTIMMLNPLYGVLRVSISKSKICTQIVMEKSFALKLSYHMETGSQDYSVNVAPKMNVRSVVMFAKVH